MNAVERWIRYVAYTVIGLFLLAVAAFVGAILFEAVQRNPHALVEMLALPGCWIVICGPILLWISLVAFYFRLPKDIRRAHVSEYRYLNPGVVVALAQEYHRIHGFDWLLWIVTASGVLTLGLILLVLNNAAPRRR